MAQKRMKSVRGTLSNREAPKMKKKRSDANTNQISDSKNFNEQKKKKPKANANRISDRTKFKLSRCQQQKKKKSLDTCKEQSIVDIDSVAHSQGAFLFQQDLLREILSWLPVRSLLRFKCVEKSWNVTSDPYFRMKHESHLQDEVKFLVVRSNCSRIPQLNSLYSTSSLSSPHDVQNIDYLSSNDNPFLQILCGSCNGLVLIRVVPTSTHEFLLLWNPSTRESIRLPYPIFGIDYSTFGLGYDPTANDYKILTIYNHKLQTQCGILALKSGSWKSVDMESPKVFRNPWGPIGFENPLAFVHGAFHWIPCSWIAAFNISNEVYTRIPLSEQMYAPVSGFPPPPPPGDVSVSVLDGMLCFSSSFWRFVPNTFTLWAMKDYGVKESWTQLFKIQVPRGSVARPIYRFPDGDVLFLCRGSSSTFTDLFRTSKGRFKLWSDSLVQRLTRIDIITFNQSLINPKLLI